jgi:hypothetical protein
VLLVFLLWVHVGRQRRVLLMLVVGAVVFWQAGPEAAVATAHALLQQWRGWGALVTAAVVFSVCHSC